MSRFRLVLPLHTLNARCDAQEAEISQLCVIPSAQAFLWMQQSASPSEMKSILETFHNPSPPGYQSDQMQEQRSKTWYRLPNGRLMEAKSDTCQRTPCPRRHTPGTGCHGYHRENTSTTTREFSRIPFQETPRTDWPSKFLSRPHTPSPVCTTCPAAAASFRRILRRCHPGCSILCLIQLLLGSPSPGTP